MQKNDFLIEILTEELPPKSLRRLANHFFAELKSRIEKTGLSFQSANFFATPRRLAVMINNLEAQQADNVIERKGPALDKAYNADGSPTAACLGFSRSLGIDVSELITLPGNFVGCKQHVAGKTVFDLIPILIEESLSSLPITKPMRWGNYSQKFIRPVHAVTLLYGNDIINAEILGHKTNRMTKGHRFLHPDWISIPHPNQYISILEKAFVIADFEKRKQKIITEIDLCVKELGKNVMAIMPDELLEEVTSLVEWPQAICGNFDKSFLEVPQEALISAMQDHQRYFPIVDKHHHLLPHFITISNIKSEDKTRIIAGNERVLRARLSDAAFFFETDKKIPLENRIEKLKQIIFQQKLGTLFDKTTRVACLAAFIALKVGVNSTLAELASWLSKTDLTTELVGEFPELQGIAGYYYALNDNQPNEVAIALSEQYKPRFSGDTLPTSSLGSVIAIADRLDTLLGMFGINQAPTGDKDPLGLRRAALGVLRIIIEKQLALDLQDLLNFAITNFETPLENKNAINDTLQFIFDRIKPLYQEQNIHPNVIAAVMAMGLTEPYDIHCRIQAVKSFKERPEAESLSTANKRVSNILSKADVSVANRNIDTTLFESDAEKELANQLAEKERAINQLSTQYQEILAQLADLRIPVDNFFDHVMVMTDDKARRDNRLLMLKKLRELFLHVADIALLQ